MLQYILLTVIPVFHMPKKSRRLSRYEALAWFYNQIVMWPDGTTRIRGPSSILCCQRARPRRESLASILARNMFVPEEPCEQPEELSTFRLRRATPENGAIYSSRQQMIVHWLSDHCFLGIPHLVSHPRCLPHPVRSKICQKRYV